MPVGTMLRRAPSARPWVNREQVVAAEKRLCGQKRTDLVLEKNVDDLQTLYSAYGQGLATIFDLDDTVLWIGPISALSVTLHGKNQPPTSS